MHLFLYLRSFRMIIFAVGWLVVISSQFAQAQNVNLPNKPNIIVLMVDDLDGATLQAAIHNGFMPELNKNIINKGYYFPNSFVSNSLCCPSRATYLTGQYSHNNGVLHNVAPDGAITKFKDQETLAVWLNRAGYRTGHIGKYLNGYGYSDLNKDGKVDTTDYKYVPPGWDDWQGLLDLSTYQVYNYQMNDNGTIVKYGATVADYQTDVLAKRAADFILNTKQQETNSPFFLTITPLAPHVEVFAWTGSQSVWKWDIRPAIRHQNTVKLNPVRKPSYNEADVSDKPRWLQARREMVSEDHLYLIRQYRHRIESLRSVDDMIGKIFKALADTGKINDTIVLFTSDNGFMNGEHRLSQKLYAGHESINVPLYVYVPGLSTIKELPQLIVNTDLAPTITALAGAASPLPTDGVSFIPLLQSGTDQTVWRKRFLIEHWKAPSGSQNPDVDLDLPDYAAVFSLWPTPEGKPKALIYVRYADQTQTPEFYDFKEDPYQLNSKHLDTTPEKVQQRTALENVLSVLKSCQGQACREVEFK